MNDQTESADVAAAAAANGKTGAEPSHPKASGGKPTPAPRPSPRTSPASQPSPPPAKPDGGCEECQPGRAASGLGWLILGVAGALAYIAVDLISKGGLSRRLGGTGGWGDGGDDSQP